MSKRYKRHLILSEGERLYYTDIKRNATHLCYQRCLDFSGVLSSKNQVWNTWKSKGGNGCLLPPYMSKQLRSNCIITSARRNEFLRDSSEIDGLSHSSEWSLVILQHSWATIPSLTSVSQRKSLVMLYYQPGDIITTNITCIDWEPCRHEWKPCFRLRHENLACQEVRHCITTSDVSGGHYRQKERRVTKDTVK